MGRKRNGGGARNPHNYNPRRGGFGGGRRPAIDRTKVCPMLVRLFVRPSTHHEGADFANGVFPEGQSHIYTWKDATLEELAKLVRTVKRRARAPHARLSFAIVYPNRSGEYKVRRIGEIGRGRNPTDARQSLMDLDFEVGDYLDVAILSDESQAAVSGAAPEDNRGDGDRR